PRQRQQWHSVGTPANAPVAHYRENCLGDRLGYDCSMAHGSLRPCYKFLAGLMRLAVLLPKGRNTEIGAHRLERDVFPHEDIELLAEIELAGCAACRCTKHAIDIEETLLRLRDRREPHSDVELQDSEEQEHEAIVSNVAGLKRSLLDLALWIDAVSGED